MIQVSCTTCVCLGGVYISFYFLFFSAPIILALAHHRHVWWQLLRKCRNGVCRSDESTSSCPQDCASLELSVIGNSNKLTHFLGAKVSIDWFVGLMSLLADPLPLGFSYLVVSQLKFNTDLDFWSTAGLRLLSLADKMEVLAAGLRSYWVLTAGLCSYCVLGSVSNVL